MARRDPRVLLADIVAACERVGRYVAEMDQTDFEEDEKTISAVERELINAGEAVSLLVRASPASVAWWDTRPDEVVSFRNRAGHGYAALSSPTLYRIATESVPVLREDAARSLGNLDSRSDEEPTSVPGA